jgi:hypothetical protein
MPQYVDMDDLDNVGGNRVTAAATTSTMSMVRVLRVPAGGSEARGRHAHGIAVTIASSKHASHEDLHGETSSSARDSMCKRGARCGAGSRTVGVLHRSVAWRKCRVGQKVAGG